MGIRTPEFTVDIFKEDAETLAERIELPNHKTRMFGTDVGWKFGGRIRREWRE